MLPVESLKDLLSQKNRSTTDKLLLCLAADPAKTRQVKELKELARNSGWRIATKVNVSQFLRMASDRCVSTPEGWELTTAGRDYVHKIAGPLAGSPMPRVASALRSHLAKLSNSDTIAFVDEAIACMESHRFRAAVVLSWVGAVSALQDYVLKHHLAAFNVEAKRRDSNWRNAKTADDLSRMKETDFLDMLVSISMLGKNVKAELKSCLDRRNGCGHPNSLQIAESSVAHHVEILLLNVFGKFS